MSGSGYKIKGGHQKARTVKPYDRPQNQGFVGKVKEWLSPYSWASYFHGGDRESEPSTSSQTPSVNHQGSVLLPRHSPLGSEKHSPLPSYCRSPPKMSVSGSLPERPLKSEAFSSKNVKVCDTDSAEISRWTVNPADDVKEPLPDTSKHFLLSSKAQNPSLKFRARSNLRQSVRFAKDTFSKRSEGNGKDDSDSSWIAEANGDEGLPAIGEDLEEELEKEPAMDLSKSDESWIAEEGEEGAKPGPSSASAAAKMSKNFRPVSISLAKKELSALSVVDSSDTPTTPFSYDLGQGQLGVAQQQSYLLTPGAEATVQFISNPMFSNRPDDKGEPSTHGNSVDTAVRPSKPSYFSSNTSTTCVDSVSRRTPLMASTVTKLSQHLHNTSNPPPSSFAESSPVQQRRQELASQQQRKLAGQPPTSLQHHRQEVISSSNGSSLPSQGASSKLTSATTQRFHSLFNKSTLSSTLASNDTSESIKRSPFSSPFYSGRTAYGGASSSQKMKVKRARIEASPPPLVAQHVTVRPSPVAPRGGATTGISETAKRILSSLQTSNSPLTDARRMPMRQPPLEEPSSKRRRVGPGQSVLSPPPVTPLRPSAHLSRHSRPHPKTKDMSIHRDSTVENSSKSSSAYSTHASLSSGKGFTPSTGPPVIDFTSAAASSSRPFSAISSLKFTPAPITVEVGPSKSRLEDRGSPGAEDHGSSPRNSRKEASVMARKTGGKIRSSRRSHQHFSRKPSRDEEEDEVDAVVNPLGPPPAVGLTLGEGKTLPTITFHTKLTPKSVSASAHLPPPLKNTLQSKASTSSVSSSQPFAFSVPLPLTDSTSQAQGPRQISASFGFTVPKPHPLSSGSLGTSTTPSLTQALTTPRSALPQQLPAASKVSQRGAPPSGPALVKPRPKESTPPKQPLPLKSASIEEVFKQGAQPVKIPDASSMATLSSVKTSSASISQPRSDDVVDLTEEDEGVLPTDAPLKPLPQFAAPTGGWVCSVCCVSNKPDSKACAACQTPKTPSTSSSSSPLSNLFAKPTSTSTVATKSFATAQSFGGISSSLGTKFAPPTGSWECESCMVSNKEASSACVACSAPKPKASSKAAPPLAISAKFAPAAGSWECEACMLSNKSTAESCVACSTPKPKSKSVTSKPGSEGTGGGGSFKLGTSSIFASSEPGTSTGMSTATTTLSQFAPVKDSWSCDSCFVSNKSSDESCVACSAPKPGAKAASSNSSTTQGSLPKFSASGGLVLGASGGLKIGGEAGGGTSGSGGLKLGSGLTIGGQSAGSSGGFKLGGGLSIGGLGKKQEAVSEGGSNSTQGGLKFGSGGLKLSGGLSLGGSGGKGGGISLNQGSDSNSISAKSSSEGSILASTTTTVQSGATGQQTSQTGSVGGGFVGLGQLKQSEGDSASLGGDAASKKQPFQLKDSTGGGLQLRMGAGSGEPSQPSNSSILTTTGAPSFSFSAGKTQAATTSGAGFSLGGNAQFKLGGGVQFGSKTLAVTAPSLASLTGTSSSTEVSLGQATAGTVSTGITLGQLQSTSSGSSLGQTSLAGINFGQVKTTGIDLSQIKTTSTGINLGQMKTTSTGLNLGQLKASSTGGMNLGQVKTTSTGMNLGQPGAASTSINLGQPSFGVNLGQPKDTAASISLGQPGATSMGNNLGLASGNTAGITFGHAPGAASSAGTAPGQVSASSSLVSGPSSLGQASKNLFGQGAVSNPLSGATPFVFSANKNGGSSTTAGPTIKLPSTSSSVQQQQQQSTPFAFGQAPLTLGGGAGIQGGSATAAQSASAPQKPSIFNTAATLSSTAPNAAFQFSAGKVSNPVLKFGAGSSTAGGSGLGIGGIGSGVAPNLQFGSQQELAANVASTSQEPSQKLGTAPVPFQFGSTAAATTSAFGSGSAPFTFSAGGSGVSQRQVGGMEQQQQQQPPTFRFGQSTAPIASGSQQQQQVGSVPTTFQFGQASATGATQQQQQPSFSFGQAATSAPPTAPPSTAAGFNFNMSGNMNLNFGGAPQATKPTTFTAESTQDISKRLIKKATRRRK